MLLGAAAYVSAELGRRRAATGAAVAAGVLVLAACLLAEPIPTTLAEFPTGTPPPSG